ncbi:MAG TPA: DUF262 domain-containing protein [Terriglobia bacterium]|nr:DUF262 domain-containing protein [Terriglobia bacterium]
MATHKVNLDALIQREDFEPAIGESTTHTRAPLFGIEQLKPGQLYFSVLRKPDFQRKTDNWTPEMIVDFVQTALDDEFYPALVIWHSKQTNKVFVIDGAHRLSVIIGWVNDDYGNGEISKSFFGDSITPAQIAFHNKTKELMESKIGRYETVLRAGRNPTATDDPEMVRRGRAIATFQPQLQIVQGDAKVAERSFLKINSNPATIDVTELDVIRARRKPNAIATRALMRAGTPYFATLEKSKEIDSLAREVYDVIFGQIVEIGPQSPDVPTAGQPYSDEAFKMVLDMVNMFNGVTPAMWRQKDGRPVRRGRDQVEELADDLDGSETIKYLQRVKDIGTLVRDDGSRSPGSLGLDQAVYSYGDTGKFHPAAFLASLRLAQDIETGGKQYDFTKVRKDFEEFVVQHKFL